MPNFTFPRVFWNHDSEWVFTSTKMKQPQNSDSKTVESEIRPLEKTLALEIARRHLFSAPCSSGEKASSHPQELCQYQNMTKQGVIVSEDI